MHQGVVTLRMSTAADGNRMVEIWRSAVDATHDFVTAEDLAAIDIQVREFLPHSAMWLAIDADGSPVAFMGLTDANMDALFVHADARGQGVGRALVSFALEMHPVLTTQVNEQNGQAVGFYERTGFATFARVETDEDGRPYPLLHMRSGGEAAESALARA